MPKTPSLPYIHDRNGYVWFRRRIPLRHHEQMGLHEWKRSLGRGVLTNPRICLEARVLTDATDEAIELLNRGQSVSRSLLDDALLTLYPERTQKRISTWSEAVSIYLSHHRLTGLKKPEAAAIEQFQLFLPDKPMFETKRSDVRDWVQWLQNKRGQSAATIRRRLTSLKAIFNVTRQVAELQLDNPFEGVAVIDKGEGGDREPFLPAHLRDIEVRLAYRRLTGPTEMILMLLRSTGARPLEIGGLDAGDVSSADGVTVLKIRPNQHRGLKTRSSARLLPLPDDLGASLTAYLAGRTQGAIFPTSCHETGALSARLNKALRAAGVPKSRAYTAYSFRHTFEDALRLSDSAFEVQQALLGHAPKSMTDRYGSKRVPMAKLKQAVEDAAAIVRQWSTSGTGGTC